MARKPRHSAIAPGLPPLTEEEQALKRQITIGLQRLAAQLHQQNLDNAVLLAQQAARGRGPLVDYFAELGRRYGDTLDGPEKPALRVVKGGAS